MRFTIWREAVQISYSTNIISKATVFYIISGILTVIPPLLISYRSNGFWRKTGTYLEQPQVHFKHSLLVLMETRGGEGIVWSNIPWIMEREDHRARIPVIQSREEDENMDGLNDLLWLEMEMPLDSGEEVTAVHALLLFNYQLKRYSSVTMTGLLYLSGQGSNGHRLDVSGDLVLYQKQPLLNRGLDNRYAASPLTEEGPESLAGILAQYGRRNLTLRMVNQYVVWGGGSRDARRFTLQVNLQYPEQELTYRPGFWETVKWGWIQYLSILLVFVYLMTNVRDYVFAQQIIPTATSITNSK